MHFAADKGADEYRISVLADAVGDYEIVIAEAVDDHGDGDGDASSAAVGGSERGVLERPGDSDWFEIAATPGGLYQLTLVPDGSSADSAESRASWRSWRCESVSPKGAQPARS